MPTTAPMIAALIAAWMQGSEPARDQLEQFEEPCMGMDGPAALQHAEAIGACRYFALDQLCRDGLIDCPWAN
jgi:hypothetical protein